ncbi:DUF4129 domain-containing protein [Haloferula sargassicola]|uniref:Protein-glutamine gamma-glutamyltransferase-like C-terminal domain-containing protein n=1 Tax=Haloferula sargassicola TaxID=490096 RepID=A0ABP9UHS5_9BACT
MRIEAVTAELRPRSDWEAVDLGLALVRRDFSRLIGAWWLGMLPALLVGAGLWFLHPVFSMLFFWWWVPVGSRLVLFRLSRVLFGDRPGWRDLLRELPRAMLRRFGHRMLLARFSPWRPLTMAVEDLEGLRGKNYRLRCRTLMRRGDSSLILIFFWRLGLVAWLLVALISTVVLFLPEAVRLEWAEYFQTWSDSSVDSVAPAGMASTWLVCAAAVMCLTDVFATGAGFGIYVNHRTWIEGWDVELAFRRISARLAKVAVMLLLAFSGIDRLGAQEPQETIERVLADPAFEVHTKTTRTPELWDWVKRLFDGLGSGGRTGGGVFSALGWVLLVSVIVLGIAGLVWLGYRYRHVFKPPTGARIGPSRPQARVVMGMEVTGASLPDDITAAALAAWREGRGHEALALLYRGAISWMIRVPRVEIAESDTEMDCLRRVKGASLVEAGYFEQLTEVWSRLAYARRVPDDAVVEGLVSRWPFGKGGSA